MSTVRHRFAPEGLPLVGAVANTVVVGVTLYVLDGSLGYAAVSAAIVHIGLGVFIAG